MRDQPVQLRHLPDRYVHHPWEAAAPPRDYPPPIVDHAERRVAAVARYEAARAEEKKSTPQMNTDERR